MLTNCVNFGRGVSCGDTGGDKKPTRTQWLLDNDMSLALRICKYMQTVLIHHRTPGLARRKKKEKKHSDAKHPSLATVAAQSQKLQSAQMPEHVPESYVKT